jgi:TolB-like protein
MQVKTRVLNADEMANVNVIGDVGTEFNSWQLFHVNNKKKVGKKAYKKLKKEAERKFSTVDVDVVNVYAYTKSTSYLFSLNPFILIFGNLLGSNHKISATGNVISTIKDTPENTPTGSNAVSTTKDTPKNTPIGLEEAIKKASSIFINKIPSGSKIAVVNVESYDRNEALLVIEGIEFHLVSSNRFTIIDRNTLNLDLIRKEQVFQISGEVSDESIVQIGALSGANVVITGSIIKSENSNRLSLKALDVKTGQIITMARGPF